LRLTVWTAAAVPVPVKVATEGAFDALLANEAAADAAPVAPGVKVTVNATGWLGVTVAGKEIPLIENSEGFVPPRVTEDTVTFAPLAVRVPPAVPLEPVTTLPTATVMGLTLKVPGVAAVPVPLNATVRLGFDAFDVTAILPLKLFADGGVKVTLNDALCPGANINGVVIPAMLNPVPLTVAAEIVAFTPPVFLMVSVWVWLCPTATLVKVTGVAVRVEGVTAVPISAATKLGFDAFDVMAILPLKLPADEGVSVTLNDALCPGVSVKGVVIPDMLNPVPLTAAAEIVALTPPVFITVSVCAWLCPTTTLVNVRLAGVAVSAAGDAPVPLNAIVKLGFDAFDVMEMLPLKLFADGGVNVTLNEALCPGVNVRGVVIPDMLNPLPLSVAAEIVMLEPPVFLSVSVWLWFCPRTTLVKVKLAGVAVSVPNATAVPLRGTDKLGFDAFEVMDTLPLTLPVVAGVSVTLNEALCPGAKISGALIPEMLNPVPLTVAAEIVALKAPVFFTVSVCVWLCPTTTLLNVRLAGVAVSVPGATAVPLKAVVKLESDAFEAMDTLPLKLPADEGASVTVNDALCPGVNVNGVAIPAMLNPVPLTVDAEIVTLLLPVFCKVSVWVWFWPTCTFAKIRVVGDAVRTPGVTPLPETKTLIGVLAPLTVNDSVPVADPEAPGVKPIPNVLLWFGARVSGSVSPVTVKGALIDAADIVRFWELVFVTVSACVWLLPIGTLPKLKVLGFAVRLPLVRLPGAAPVPESAIFTGSPPAKAKLPLALPTVVGLNTIWKLTLCCGNRVKGRVKPVVLKPEPVTVACVTVTLELLVLASTSVWLWAVPVCTAPKLMLAGVAAIVPVAVDAGCVEDFPATLIPWQPSMVARASRAGIAIQRLGVFVIGDNVLLWKNSVHVSPTPNKVPKG
jgi:hypothetical protein